MCLYKWHWTWNNSLTPSPWIRSILVLTSLILSFFYFSMRSNCVLIYNLVVDYCCISMYSTLVSNSLQDKWELDRNIVLGGSGAFPVSYVWVWVSVCACNNCIAIIGIRYVRITNHHIHYLNINFFIINNQSPHPINFVVYNNKVEQIKNILLLMIGSLTLSIKQIKNFINVFICFIFTPRFFFFFWESRYLLWHSNFFLDTKFSSKSTAN